RRRKPSSSKLLALRMRTESRDPAKTILAPSVRPCLHSKEHGARSPQEVERVVVEDGSTRPRTETALLGIGDSSCESGAKSMLVLTLQRMTDQNETLVDLDTVHGTIEFVVDSSELLSERLGTRSFDRSPFGEVQGPTSKQLQHVASKPPVEQGVV